MLRYAITPGTLTSPNSHEAASLIARCVALAEGGIEFLLLRERRLDHVQLADLTRRVVEATRDSGTRVMVPGDPGIARDAGAAGVHLSARPGEVSVGEVRRRFPEAHISVSCHAAEELAKLPVEVDLVLFAPVFGKVVDGATVVEGLGLDALCKACATPGRKQVFALGGVNAANAGRCAEAGAAGVAGIRMFFGEADDDETLKRWRIL